MNLLDKLYCNIQLNAMTSKNLKFYSFDKSKLNSF